MYDPSSNSGLRKMAIKDTDNQGNLKQRLNAINILLFSVFCCCQWNCGYVGECLQDIPVVIPREENVMMPATYLQITEKQHIHTHKHIHKFRVQTSMTKR